jgi:hypothetical protein
MRVGTCSFSPGATRLYARCWCDSLWGGSKNPQAFWHQPPPSQGLFPRLPSQTAHSHRHTPSSSTGLSSLLLWLRIGTASKDPGPRSAFTHASICAHSPPCWRQILLWVVCGFVLLVSHCHCRSARVGALCTLSGELAMNSDVRPIRNGLRTTADTVVNSPQSPVLICPKVASIPENFARVRFPELPL